MNLWNPTKLKPPYFKAGDKCLVNGTFGVVVEAPRTTEGLYLIELEGNVFSVLPRDVSIYTEEDDEI